jgi:DNA-binding NtrC family response regulator
MITAMARIEIIEDDVKISRMLERIARGAGHETVVADTLVKGVAACRDTAPDLVLLDLTLPDGNGLDILPDLKNSLSQPDIIIVTGTGDQRGAEVAFNHGAWDFVPKPFMPEDVLLPIDRALQYRQEKRATQQPRILNREGIIGDSAEMTICLELVARASITDADVLITGETGTGKELFAKSIHNNSHRNTHPFVIVDCAAYPEHLMESALFGHEKGAFTGADKKRTGLIMQADKGTLFLDEVGELTLTMQKMFLRVLQEGTFRPLGASGECHSDFRLVAATNRNLEKMVEGGQFRLDLMHRLRSISINLPPLRDHSDDIDPLVLHYLQTYGKRNTLSTKGISPEFIQTLKSYHWPGNIRELFSTMDYALVSAGNNPTLHQINLPPGIRISRFDGLGDETSEGETELLTDDMVFSGDLSSLKSFREAMLEKAEAVYLIELMRRTRGRIKDACEIAQLSESRLHALLKKYDTPRFR